MVTRANENEPRERYVVYDSNLWSATPNELHISWIKKYFGAGCNAIVGLTCFVTAISEAVQGNKDWTVLAMATVVIGASTLKLLREAKADKNFERIMRTDKRFQ